jgi:3-oxoacyl-[acyl-carrier-protein] synthase-3
LLVGNGTKLVGSRSATPKTIVSNDDLSKLIDTNDEQISARTRIRNRQILSSEDFIVPKDNKNLIFLLDAF